MNVHWPTVAIVGVGLIGGSIGRALLTRKLATRVIGVGRSPASLDAARRTGAVTETAVDPAAVADADLVVVATGVKSIPRLLDAVDRVIEPGTLVTDAGSTKASIVAAWEKSRRSRRGRFVGSHPLAGSHRRGPEAADPELFTGRVTVVTPAAATPPAALPFTAGGWRDTTRIASGDAELWADILLDNAAAVTAAVKRVETAAARILAAVEAGDRRRLVTLLTRAKDARDALGS